MSPFTRNDHRFARAMNVDLGEPVPPQSEDDELAENILRAIDSGRFALRAIFDEEIGEPTIEDWREYSEGVEKEAAQYHRNWLASERNLEAANRHLDVVNRRYDGLIKIASASMGCTVILLFLFIGKWLIS